MSDNSPRHDFDDERLSAYLDDELPPEERAVVARRLATDPAARTMLDELRRVSESVRGLPKQTLGDDVRGAVLRRAAEAKRAAHASPHPMPKLTIGRTKRGWIWASLTVAAGLLIMFVQRDELNEENGVSIAQHRREPSSLTAAPERAAPPARSQPATRDLAEAGSAPAPLPPDELSGTVRSDSAEGRAAGVPTVATGIDDEPLVVVHVLAKRAALENRAFDQLLVSNGIAVEPAVPAASTTASPDRVESLATSRLESDRGATAPATADDEADVYLVEAPPRQIFSCVSALNEDYSNYLSVAVVEDALGAAAALPKAAPAKKLAADLEKYSRGVVPQQQKDLLTRNKAYHYQQSPGRFAGGSAGSLLDDESGIAKQENRPSPKDKHAIQGRAQRVLISNYDGRETKLFRELGRQLKATAEPDDDSLQVLFVLAPGDEPAASPAAENTTE